MIGCGIAFWTLGNDYQSAKALTERWFNLLFK